ncbi:hypothetical protein ACFV20_35435 [Streptomyces sp. NPDC059696]|uniref:hypothetical protein n=1 Tax=Streptomyces sp. NPDC059696 TaxID=3346911 RepID=UPI0036ADE0D6
MAARHAVAGSGRDAAQDAVRPGVDSWLDFRTRCDAILDGLPLEQSQPLTVDALCAAIAQRHGRPLTRRPCRTRRGP